MKRLAMVCTALCALLLADGLYMQVSNYQPGDQDPFFGDANLIMSDGTTVLVAAAFLTIITAIMWAFVVFRGRSSAQRQH
jgi:hypothetical protein